MFPLHALSITVWRQNWQSTTDYLKSYFDKFYDTTWKTYF